MEATRTHRRGGRREGSGRKRLAPEGAQAITVTLTADQVAYLRTVGGGNVSAGIRRLIAEAATGDRTGAAKERPASVGR